MKIIVFIILTIILAVVGAAVRVTTDTHDEVRSVEETVGDNKKNDYTDRDDRDDTLSVTQAAAQLGQSRSSIYNLIHSGRLMAYKDGRIWKINRLSLLRYARASPDTI